MDDQSVLVVEGGAGMQSHLLAFLRMRGYASVLATSVGEALDPLAHRSSRFTLLDLDLNGHDAAEMVQRLKLRGGDPGPVIGFSRGTNGRHELDSSLLAVDAVLDTPLAYGDLDRAIADILVTPERAAGQVQGGHRRRSTRRSSSGRAPGCARFATSSARRPASTMMSRT